LFLKSEAPIVKRIIQLPGVKGGRICITLRQEELVRKEFFAKGTQSETNTSEKENRGFMKIGREAVLKQAGRPAC